MNSQRMSEEEFDIKYDLYHDMLFKIAYAYLKSIPDTEDVIQNVYIKFYTKNIRFKSLEHEKFWFIRVTINECKNLLKSSWYRKVSLDNNQIDSIKEETHPVLNNKIIDYVYQLNSRYKEVVILYYFQDLPVKNIANILGISDSNVKKRLERARNILKTIV